MHICNPLRASMCDIPANEKSSRVSESKNDVSPKMIVMKNDLASGDRLEF